MKIKETKFDDKRMFTITLINVCINFTILDDEKMIFHTK